MKSKFFRAVLLMLAMSIGSVTMAGTMPASDKTVRIQLLPGVVSLLAQVAVERGYCTQNGITCTLIPNPSSPLGLQALLGGSLDVATPAIIPALQLAAKGTPIRLIGTFWQKNPFIFALQNSTSTSALPKDMRSMMHELKGKKIGVTARGSGPEYVLDAFLAEADMKPTDVTIVAVGSPTTAYAALVNKQIDAAVSYEPMGALCDVLKTCRIYAMLGRGEWPKELDAMDGAQAPLVVRSDYAEKNPKVIAALQNAFREAEGYVKVSANFDELMQINKKYFNMESPRSDELIADMLRNSMPGYLSRIDPKAVQAAADYMLRTGQLDKPFDTSGLVLQ